MEFRVIQDPNAFSHTLQCRYRDMLGNDKVLCRQVSHTDLINGGPAGEVLEFVKHRMRQEISHELGQQAVQVQEQAMTPYYATQISNYAVTNTNYWDGTAAGGGGTGGGGGGLQGTLGGFYPIG
jgi:hypothetical protein